MVDWALLKTNLINRVGYNKQVQTLYIDFNGSDIDTAFVNVPEPLYEFFINAKSPDRFFKQFVDGYFDVAQLQLDNYINAGFHPSNSQAGIDA